MNSNVEAQVMCTVTMDGETTSSEDFVAILSKENGDAAIFYNTDAITLGMAMKMVAKSFVDSMAQLSEDERNEVTKILGGDFDVDVDNEETTEEE